MKAPYAWIQSYCDVNVTPEAFAEAMTLTGSKVEEIVDGASAMNGVVTGRIVSVELHPNADTLQIAHVDIKTTTLTLVTAATNVSIGDIVVVATVGATLPDGRTIERATLRGVASEGMMLSIEELGLTHGDCPDAPVHGLYVLPATTAIGLDAREALGLADVVIDFDITPNRPDCLAIEGLAREASVALSCPFHPATPVVRGQAQETTAERVHVEIADPARCRRFVARLVTDVVIEPSPVWMRRWLRACGVRPINNVVDVTNAVMLALGQPLHAYDLTALQNGVLQVREAEDGEMIVTLDGETRSLVPPMLVIADAKRPVGVAGVMGGADSEITPTTRTIVLEAASFDGASVRQTSVALGLRSEASARFEKGLAPEGARRALDLACAWLESFGAGQVAPDTIDIYPGQRDPRYVTTDARAVSSLIGVTIDQAFMDTTLTRLGFVFDDERQAWRVPSFRDDVEGDADIAEEVARFYGYNRIEPTLSAGSTLTVGGLNARQRLDHALVDRMVAAGAYETITMPFTNEATRRSLGLPGDDVMHLANPLNETMTEMRTTLLSAHAAVVAYNEARGERAGRLMERGRTYHRGYDGTPYEVERLALTVFDQDGDKKALFFALKGLVQAAASAVGAPALTVVAETSYPALHPGMAATIELDGQPIGMMGLIHPRVAQALDVDVRLAYAELNVDVMLDHGGERIEVKPLPRHPAVVRDLSLLAEASLTAATLEGWIRKAAGATLESIHLFDEYKDAQMGPTQRSLAYRLTFRDLTRTLSDDDLAPIMAAIGEALSRHGVRRR